ncbi:hypothetical protein M0804_011846 [Polistes exclamans]|nr:hypothetical protein M0804_011846 [Polistes exclamans]
MASLTRDAQRVHKVNVEAVENPKSRKNFVISQELIVTGKGHKLLLHDSFESQEWAGDGNFSSVPSIFKQLYTVHDCKWFTLNVRMLMAIAFVPKHDVRAAFDELIRCKYYEENEVVLEPLVSYFEHTWISIP